MHSSIHEQYEKNGRDKKYHEGEREIERERESVKERERECVCERERE
jgi:hypothetical protein